MKEGPVYALNLFNITDKAEYLAYVKNSAKEVEARGGKVVALGSFRETETGEIEPRQVMLLVEWESPEGLQSYLHDADLKELHSRRINGTSDYIWHFYDKLADFRPLVK